MEFRQVVPAHVIVKVEMPPPAVLESKSPMRPKEPILSVDAERLERGHLVFLRTPCKLFVREKKQEFEKIADDLAPERPHEKQANHRYDDAEPYVHALTFSIFSCRSTS